MPMEDRIDRIRILSQYQSLQTYNTDTYKDIGWLWFVKACGMIFGGNYILFFVFVSLIYTFSYFFFGKHNFGKDYLGYFVLFAFGSFAFVAYGVATIRNGIALSLLLLSFSFDRKVWLKLLLASFALLIHKSVILIIAGYFLSLVVKKKKYAYAIWGLCFIFSASNLDLTPIFENLGFIDSRVESYGSTLEAGGENDRYEQGFRIDFIIYSLLPILITFLYSKKHKVSNLYQHLYLTYILVNAAWLLVIRMAYTNRIAYLSWFLIPYLTLYPLIANRERIRKGYHKVLAVMSFFMAISTLLALRNIANI